MCCDGSTAWQAAWCWLWVAVRVWARLRHRLLMGGVVGSREWGRVAQRVPGWEGVVFTCVFLTGSCSDLPGCGLVQNGVVVCVL